MSSELCSVLFPGKGTEERVIDFPVIFSTKTFSTGKLKYTSNSISYKNCGLKKK